jgi:opacity protein-like surface antigen
MILAGCVLVCLAVSDAKAFWIGGYGSYSDGGDVTDNKTGLGMQAGGRIDDTFSVEISGTHFKDTVQGAGVDITSLAVTGLAGVDLIENTARLYVGAGLDYNMFNAHMSGFAATIMNEDVRFQDTAGYHVCAGASVNLNEALQIFAQYRYTWAKMKGDLTYGIPGNTQVQNDAVDQDYKFGLFMVGVNLML